MESKQRLRPWLEAQISSGEIPGLCWVNDEKTKFKIPWKHGGKHDWIPDSGLIFKEWARHTGRFREGIDEPDYVKWKTRLRCAFNKAPDIEEVKEESQLDGPDPYRVYLLKPRKNGKRTAQAESKTSVCSSFTHVSAAQTAAPLPAILDSITMVSAENLPSDLKGIKSGDMFPIESAAMSVLADDVDMLSDNFRSLTFAKEEKTEVNADIDSSMYLNIFYCGKEVMDRMVTAPRGCRVYYSTFTKTVLADLPNWISPLTYETNEVDCLCLPPCNGLMNSPKQETFWQSILEKSLSDGICIATHNYDIYAIRFCACQIYFATECGTSGYPVPLRRQNSDSFDEPVALTKIFDYHEKFVPAFNKYLAGMGPKPSTSVSLIFGVELPLSKLHLNPGIHIIVTSSKAMNDLQGLSDDRVISSDEKLTAAILEYEAAMKTEETAQYNSEWTCPQETASAMPDNLVSDINDLLRQEFILEDTSSFTVGNSTIDFSDLLDL